MDGDRLTFSPTDGEQGFFDKSPWVRLGIGVLFALCLFVVIHYRQVRMEMLEPGSVATKYVVAQVDFSFPDSDRTIIKQQEAVRDIGPIYQITPSEITKVRTEVEKLLSSDDSWRELSPGVTYEEMHVAVDQYAHDLGEMRLTDSRTLKKVESLKQSIKKFFIYQPTDAKEPVNLPAEFWDHVAARVMRKDGMSQSAVDLISTEFDLHHWMLTESVALVDHLRNLVRASVPPVITKVKAGTRIIDRGERVTPSDIPMLQALNKAMARQRNLWSPATLAGSLIMTLVVTTIAGLYLGQFHARTYRSNKRLFLLVAMLVLTFVLAKIVEYFVLRGGAAFSEAVKFPVFVPFAAIILSSLLGTSIAVAGSTLLTIVLTIALAVDRGEFLIINLVASIVAILSTHTLRHRKEVFIICGKAWASCVAVVLAVSLYDNIFLDWSMVNGFISTFIFMLVTAVLVVGLLPLLESVFRIITDVTLIEYMDPMHPLLRRLSIEAPGTYQHSIVVGNLAEAAAIAINANGLFCRAATLYHDIGKLVNPQYFTENQQGGINPHQLLTPLESAEAIMAHVPDGVQIARKHNIPEPFIDIIKEHHGNTLVYYFYHNQCQQEGQTVDQMPFRYPGPRPRSRESAIIMIADTVEAASRSMDEPTEEKVQELVDRLVHEKAEDGQFNRCQLTFRELGKVKQSLVKSIVNARHTRIKYPARMPPSGSADDPAWPPADMA